MSFLSNLRITLIPLQYTNESDMNQARFHASYLSQSLRLQDLLFDSSLIQHLVQNLIILTGEG